MRFQIRRKPESKAFTVWGIRSPDSIRMRWISISRILGVPCNRLILFILKDWAIRNREVLLDEDGRKELSSRITKYYLTGGLG